MANKITPAERVALWAMRHSKTCSGGEIATDVRTTFTRTSTRNIINGLAIASNALIHEAHDAKTLAEAASLREQSRRVVAAEALVREHNATSRAS